MTRLDDEMYRLNLRLDFLRGFAKMKLETYLTKFNFDYYANGGL